MWSTCGPSPRRPRRRCCASAPRRRTRCCACSPIPSTPSCSRPRHGSALDELESHRGTQFDPDITDALLDLIVSQELEDVAYDSTLTEMIKDSRLHDPEWVLSRSADRKRQLTTVMDPEVVDVAVDN